MRLALPFLSALTTGLVFAACSSSSTPKSSSNTTSGAGGSSAHSSTSSGHPTASNSSSSSGVGGSISDAAPDVHIVPPPDGSILDPCSLAGSLVFTKTGKSQVVGGDPSWPSLDYLTLPAGFCAHYFATVPNARQIRFAPGGELFVASPTAGTTSGGLGGLDAIVLLADDNQDGVGDATVTFLKFPTQSTTQGMLFAPGFFYYQDGSPPGTTIQRMPYTTGQRAAGVSEQVAMITAPQNSLHWPKTMDMADDGTIYVGNGGGQGDPCNQPHAFLGGILKIDPAPGGAHPNGQQVAQGFRNPINVRCRPGNNTCFALELAWDYSDGKGGREKMVQIRQGDDWGFPCCATANTPYGGIVVLNQNNAIPDCSGVAQETNAFFIGDTPFGVDFELGHWPAPWGNRAFVALHGAAGSWTGARIFAIPMDTTTGLSTPSSDIDGGDVAYDFATGWDDNTNSHGRPTAVTFHPDGRLFVADDQKGIIFWIAKSM